MTAPKRLRINVTVTPGLFEVLGRLARLQRTSRARIIAEMLGESEPHLRKLSEILEMAQKGKRVAAERTIRDMIEDGLAAMDELDQAAEWKERFQTDPDATDANWMAYRDRITGK